jgi:hypothetical protein
MVTSEVSRVNELSNAFLDRSRLEPLQVNIPQDGQHLRHSVPNEVLQIPRSGIDTSQL